MATSIIHRLPSYVVQLTGHLETFLVEKYTKNAELESLRSYSEFTLPNASSTAAAKTTTHFPGTSGNFWLKNTRKMQIWNCVEVMNIWFEFEASKNVLRYFLSNFLCSLLAREGPDPLKMGACFRYIKSCNVQCVNCI